jgi:hypothetical protein
MRRALSFAFCALLAYAPAATAALPVRHASPTSAQQVDFAQTIDANTLQMALTNEGSFAFNALALGPGLFFPKGTSASVVFAGGLWLGATVSGTPRVTVADYDFEFRPGRVVGGIPEPSSPPDLRVYKLLRNYSDTFQRDEALSEYVQGAVPRGAPPVAVLADGSLSIRGDQMCWSVCNDLNAAAHTSSSGSTSPLGLEVRQTTWAYDAPAPLGNSVLVEFKIVNRGSSPLADVHLGLFLDPDVGGFTDDLLACDTTRSLGYGYNSTNFDAVYGSRPPAVGIDLLQGPFSPAVGHRLPMTAFVSYPNGSQPAGAGESFRSMHGLALDGSPILDPSSNVTKFMFAGNPVAASGWLDPAPEDKRYLLSSGPFAMPAGGTQTVVLGVLVSQGTNRLDSVARLRADDDLLQTAFDSGALGLLDAPTPSGRALSLERVSPNPVRDDLDLGFVLPEPGETSVELLDLAGRRVFERPLGSLPAGPHTTRLAGAAGSLSPGVYFVRLTHAHVSVTRRVALSR